MCGVGSSVWVQGGSGTLAIVSLILFDRHLWYVLSGVPTGLSNNAIHRVKSLTAHLRCFEFLHMTSTTCRVSTTSFLGFLCPVWVSVCSHVVNGRSPRVSRASELICGALAASVPLSSHFESMALTSTTSK
ncbi:hypothetical protein EV401DRAFT_1139221 [Pisolithus croceorrhizus]|nr:hypothetical protein EV401DRAFT_1139221 [Pisolithus croceorrhizus]